MWSRGDAPLDPDAKYEVEATAAAGVDDGLEIGGSRGGFSHM
jgi:hypothetical protein